MEGEFSWPSAEDLTRLLVYAVRDGIELVEEGGVTYATSADGSRRYRVDEGSCECKAGEYERWCKHRALYVALRAREVAARRGLPAWMSGVVGAGEGGV